jgi:hypothetical protein
MRELFRPTRLVPAALGTGLFAWFVPINEALPAKLAVLLVVWATLAYGIHVFSALFTAGMARAVPDSHRNVRPAQVEPLDATGRVAVSGIVALFERAGVFAPAAPRPEQLYEAVADLGKPVTQGIVLTALQEASFHHAGFDAPACMAMLAFHASHTEQSRDTVERQVADLIRLSGGSPDVSDLAIELRPDAGKWLSTRIHVELARVLHTARAPRRLAWLWTDQGAWIAGLEPDSLELLNAGPGGLEDGGEGWSWVDEAEPDTR